MYTKLAHSEDIGSRKAAKSAHPDKGGSEEKMAAVNEAYEVLSDPGTFRSRSDQTTEQLT